MSPKPLRALLLLASLALVPAFLAAPAAADAAGCPATYTTVDATAAGRGILHVGADGSVWQESNAILGLQCYPTSFGGRLFAPDTRVVL